MALFVALLSIGEYRARVTRKLKIALRWLNKSSVVARISRRTCSFGNSHDDCTRFFLNLLGWVSRRDINRLLPL